MTKHRHQYHYAGELYVPEAWRTYYLNEPTDDEDDDEPTDDDDDDPPGFLPNREAFAINLCSCGQGLLIPVSGWTDKRLRFSGGLLGAYGKPMATDGSVVLGTN